MSLHKPWIMLLDGGVCSASEAQREQNLNAIIPLELATQHWMFGEALGIIFLVKCCFMIVCYQRLSYWTAVNTDHVSLWRSWHTVYSANNGSYLKVLFHNYQCVRLHKFLLVLQTTNAIFHFGIWIWPWAWKFVLHNHFFLPQLPHCAVSVPIRPPELGISSWLNKID